MTTTTLREFLDATEFDWSTGKLIIQPETGWDNDVKGARFIKLTDPILDKTFDSGYGSPECPSYIAEDKEALYFPSQYDGSTSPVKVYKKIKKYLEIPSPYPGG